MKITKITHQLKRAGRYSVYVDEQYSFSLSESALLESRIASGQELTAQQVEDFKRLSADDKLYSHVLRYVAMRPRSTWEVEFYLQRKHASPALISQTVNKLTKIDLLNDEKFAKAFVHDRQLLRPASRRKIISELKKKRVPEQIINDAINGEGDEAALKHVISVKRRQSKYQDDEKLMQYLARQGFNYHDIKQALQADDTDG